MTAPTAENPYPRLRAAFDKAAKATAEVVPAVVQQAARTWADWLVIEANSLHAVAGVEAQYFVRAGLDPAYATPEALDALVQAILGAADLDAGLWLLTRENRALVAAAAIRGWAGHRGRDAAPSPYGVTWHRQLGATTVRVGR